MDEPNGCTSTGRLTKVTPNKRYTDMERADVIAYGLDFTNIEKRIHQHRGMSKPASFGNYLASFLLDEMPRFAEDKAVFVDPNPKALYFTQPIPTGAGTSSTPSSAKRKALRAKRKKRK